jgi:ABC-2 type transport system permease protein
MTAATATTSTAAPRAAKQRATGIGYTRLEIVRTFRNVRFFLFSLVFPLVLFYLVAGPNRGAELGGIPFAVYYMIGMASWGTMTAVIAGGARIAADRTVGWNRQLRITPLSPRTYFEAKVVTGYLMAVVSIVLLYAAGLTLGVSLSLRAWLTMTALILIGLIPFAALGVLMGHLLTADSMGPALGGVTSLLALLGGAWGPVAEHGILHGILECIPSYWLVRAGGLGISGELWPARGWLVMAAWTVVLVALAGRAYRRDTARV